MSEASRFWSKIDKNGPIHPVLGTPCWNWVAGVDGKGYGTFRERGRRGRQRLAHRKAWELVTGTTTEQMLLHHCDNARCVNPAHLYQGDQAQNMRDKVRRGRQTRGEAHPDAKVTRAQVGEIRTRYAAGETQGALSREFGISQPSVSSIVRRITWQEI